MGKRLFSNFLLVGLAIFASLFVVSPGAPSSPPYPALKVHPLPPTLVSRQDTDESGDYWAEVISTPVGALVWSRFPVTVFIRPDGPDWVKSARGALEEWDRYLSLREVNRAESADIVIEREFPPSEVHFDPETGRLEIPRARSALTRYEIFVKDGRLTHRMTVRVRPNLGTDSTLAAIRHELGHALGIWGHSPRETDVMYFSQTREIPSISARDVNTLRKVYQQPTRLGWEMG